MVLEDCLRKGLYTIICFDKDKINPDQFVILYNEQISAIGLMLMLESTDPSIMCKTRDIIAKVDLVLNSLLTPR